MVEKKILKCDSCGREIMNRKDMFTLSNVANLVKHFCDLDCLRNFLDWLKTSYEEEIGKNG